MNAARFFELYAAWLLGSCALLYGWGRHCRPAVSSCECCGAPVSSCACLGPR